MEGRYRGLLEAAPDAMVIVNDGEEIVLLNAQAEKRFGYSRDQLIGRKVQTIIPQGFAERLIADKLRPRKTPWHSRSRLESNSKGGAKTAPPFPSRSC